MYDLGNTGGFTAATTQMHAATATAKSFIENMGSVGVETDRNKLN
jgi:hypothetical protein